MRRDEEIPGGAHFGPGDQPSNKTTTILGVTSRENQKWDCKSTALSLMSKVTSGFFLSLSLSFEVYKIRIMTSTLSASIELVVKLE